MFTGLIKDIGTIKSITPNPSGLEFWIETKLTNEIGIDDSVAVNGCCLTATQVKDNLFKVQAVHVTLEKTSIGKLQVGSKCNLELALRASDRLGGHIVQGHVNGIGKIKQITPRGKNIEVSIEAPNELTKYMIDEGSICLDGISLTIAKINNNMVTVSIIPHTFDVTHLHSKKVGDIVNIEVDVLAKYVEKLVNSGRLKGGGITKSMLEGF